MDLNILFVVIISLLPLVILYKWGSAKSKTEYYTANSEILSEDFIRSSVAYGYQVAAISLFTYWGYQYGLWTLLVAVFWALGFQFLRRFIRKGAFDEFLINHKNKTLHGFLATKFQNKKIVARIAGIATVLGLSGTAFFEAEYTSKVISTAFSGNQDNKTLLVLFFIFIVIALIYVVLGGLRSVIKTERIQLGVSFILFNLFCIFIFIKLIEIGYAIAGFTLLIMSSFCIAILSMMYSKFHLKYTLTFKRKLPWTLKICLVLYIISFIYIAFFVLPSITSKDNYESFIGTQKILNLFSLGISLPALFIANYFWQIVDISSWQRLASLNNITVQNEEKSRVLIFIGWYSAVTWTIAIFLGMALRYLNPDFIEYVKFLFNNGIRVDKLFVYLLFISLIYIMFSTLNSLISAISYTVTDDIISAKDNLFLARLYTFLYTVAFAFLYYFVRKRITTIDSILYTFYSFQIALLPSIINVLLLKRSIYWISGVVSIVFGCLGTVIPLFINSFFLNPYTAAAIFSVGFATIGLIIGNWIQSRRRIKTKT